MRSPDVRPAFRAPFRPLLAKELWQIVGGRALWTMLLLLCPLVGYSFVQAVSLYREASLAVVQSPALASGLSPLDGVLVPTFGAFYVAVTLLFPFVAIRVLGHEKETGALRLLIQLPYRTSSFPIAKSTFWNTSLPERSRTAAWNLEPRLCPSKTVPISVSETAMTLEARGHVRSDGSLQLDAALDGRGGEAATASLVGVASERL